jgi:CO/xanthine dehydrogenase Mo-binding subunit
MRGRVRIPNIEAETFGVFTNNIHSGAFRGYSSPELLFAQEQFIEEIGEELGLSPLEMRRINCRKNGSTVATGAEVEHVILPELIDFTAKQTGYERKHAENRAQRGVLRRGVGIGNSRIAAAAVYGAESPDAAGAFFFNRQRGGSVLLHSGLAENGQGLMTVYCQIAAEAYGVPFERAFSFTARIRNASRLRHDRGLARNGDGRAARPSRGRKLNRILRGECQSASTLFTAGKGGAPRDRTADEYFVLLDSFFFDPDYPDYRVFACGSGGLRRSGGHVPLPPTSGFTPPPCLQDHATQQGKAFPTYSYACVVAEVEVDTSTGEVSVLRVTSSHDTGTAINPALIQGQVYGGVVMGQGYGTMEEVVTKNGLVKTQNLDEYLIPTAMDMPENPHQSL